MELKYKLFASDNIDDITAQLNEFIKRMEIDDVDILADGISFNDGMHMFYIRYEED